MRPASRTSTPKYMDVSQGRTCGNCTHCPIDDMFPPANLGNCSKLKKVVNIRKTTTCNDWKERGAA